MKNQNIKTSIAGYSQAIVAVLSALGVVISPEDASALTAGGVALMGVIGAIKGHFTKDK